MKLCVVICFAFVFVECVQYVNSLKVSEKGVCVSKHTVVKTRPKTVLVAINKWCGKKKCTVRQTRQQKYSVVTNRLMCCNGFIYTAASDSCAPVCSTGCLNGTCTDPDVCSCDPPTYLDLVTKNKCITPICDHQCINSNCTVNNTCTCLDGFTPINATHCAPNCTAGFQLNSSLSCVPKCDNCTNGKCVAPDTCSCDPGYKLNGTCEPECQTPCVNAKCVAPNVCKCLEGYTTGETGCVPKCDTCVNGICTAPNKCKCLDGYIANGTEANCVPKCNDCVNGLCTAPNVCKCLKGYITNGTGNCVPKCESCINGLCTAPNTCQCLEGYVPNGNKSNCVPKCDACEHGLCVGPNVCECKEGYSKVNETCEPICKERCVNGHCSAPGVCACDEGFVMKNATVCYQPCTGACRPNGTCEVMKTEKRVMTKPVIVVEPCKNRKRAKCTRMVPKKESYVIPHTVCCEGYEYVEENGTDFCKPECPLGCEGGQCIAPDTCECPKPLILVDYKCIPPTCHNPCINGDCTAPDTCSCYEGYILKEDNFTCVAECTNCDNGYCVKPNECTCNEGYSMKEGKCNPVCKKDCDNGFCSKPDVCSCNDGYELREGVCKPVCNTPCTNGSCVAPNRCECFDGYEKNGHNGTCKPKCDSCNNGECVAPNHCMCHAGYSMKDNVCTPVCQEKCVNGHCSAPNECTCKEDYTKNVTKPFVCYKPCSFCEFGACDLDGKCNCNDGYEIINGTCTEKSSLDAPDTETPIIVASGIASETSGLAGLETSWLVGGAVGLLLVILVLVAIQRMWRRREDYGPKTADDGNHYGSVIYTVPDTLIRNSPDFGSPDEDLNETDEESSETLMTKETNDVV